MRTTICCVFGILSAFSNYASSLTCLSCEEISHPRYCHAVSTCAPNESCYAKTVTTGDHRKAYQLGCTDKITGNTLCHNSTLTDASGQRCFGCCTSNLCNAALCAEKGYPSGRGPICYSCDTRELGEPCNYINPCEVGEVCSIAHRLEFSTVVYTSECSHKHVCESHSLAIVGKRLEHGEIEEEMLESDNDLQLGKCHVCCSKDLCNTNCSSRVHTDHCSSAPCRNGGTCRDSSSGATCLCPPGYIGNYCEHTDPCSSQPCQNGGTCVVHGGQYACTCPTGFAGRNCEADPCGSQPCHNGGTCVVHGGQYTCTCPIGFTGTNCEADPCSSQPCQNGGTCVVQGSQYTCTCPTGFTGTNCETYPCSSQPCQNGGTCMVHGGQYTCTCPTGFTGNNCEAGFDCSSFSNGRTNHTAGDVYQVWFNSSEVREVREVVCDLTTDGGGWMVMQRRFNGTVDFYRNYSDYNNGFGDIHGEFWLGLQYVYSLVESCTRSTGNMKLRFDLEDAEGNKAYRTYDNFSISSAPKYTVNIGRSSGTANRYHDESQGFEYNIHNSFSTFDHGTALKCVYDDLGGWWYGSCTWTNVNGIYLHPPGQVSDHRSGQRGMTYYSFDNYRSLKATEMKIKCS